MSPQIRFWPKTGVLHLGSLNFWELHEKASRDPWTIKNCMHNSVCWYDLFMNRSRTKWSSEPLSDSLNDLWPQHFKNPRFSKNTDFIKSVTELLGNIHIVEWDLGFAHHIASLRINYAVIIQNQSMVIKWNFLESLVLIQTWLNNVVVVWSWAS